MPCSKQMYCVVEVARHVLSSTGVEEGKRVVKDEPPVTPVAVARRCVEEVDLPVGEVCTSVQAKPPVWEVEAEYSMQVGTGACTCKCEGGSVALEQVGVVREEVKGTFMGKPSVTDGAVVKLKWLPNVIYLSP